MSTHIDEIAMMANEQTGNKFDLNHKELDTLLKKFAELIIEKVLDEVSERAYYSGDSAWSNDLDRQWVELEFGIGKLAELKNERTN